MMIYCAECENACSDKASTCPKCGHPLMAPDKQPNQEPHPRMLADLVSPYQRGQTSHVPEARIPRPEWNAGIAAALSFFIPGLGQLYKGQIFGGLAWFVVVLIGYFALIVPGIILHVCCIIGATLGNPYTDK